MTAFSGFYESIKLQSAIVLVSCALFVCSLVLPVGATSSAESKTSKDARACKVSKAIWDYPCSGLQILHRSSIRALPIRYYCCMCAAILGVSMPHLAELSEQNPALPNECWLAEQRDNITAIDLL